MGPTLCFFGLRTFSLRLYPQLRNSHTLLGFDLGLWFLNGLVIAIFNALAFSFPVGSGAKVIFGSLCLGSFVAGITSLCQERREIELGTKAVNLKKRHFVSISKKFAIFSGLCLIEFAVIVSLIVVKDLHHLLSKFQAGVLEEQFRHSIVAISIEIGFVLAIVLTGSVTIFVLYSQNLKAIFDKILQTLAEVERGNLDAECPVMPTDEFSIICDQTNKMILGLRDKERIRGIFGKFVDPKVARHLIEEEGGANLGGHQTQMVVLFSDIRNFTGLSENLNPEKVVELLNIYFTEFVKVIQRHRGVVDKFIGDAIMAVFGLDDTAAAARAVETALEVLEQLPEINSSLKASGLPPIEIGIGVHSGAVIAGNIGSRERLEYTVIGDVVNIASRLESLTKSLGSPLAVSKDVYEDLPQQLQTRLEIEGLQKLKGKAQSIQVFKMK